MAGPAPRRQRGVHCSTAALRKPGKDNLQATESIYSICETHDVCGTARRGYIVGELSLHALSFPCRNIVPCKLHCHLCSKCYTDTRWYRELRHSNQSREPKKAHTVMQSWLANQCRPKEHRNTPTRWPANNICQGAGSDRIDTLFT